MPLRAPAVIKICSGCYEIWLLGQWSYWAVEISAQICGRHTIDNHTQWLVFRNFSQIVGEQGFTSALLHMFCPCPLAFASVSCHFKALFTTLYQHQPVVYEGTCHFKVYASDWSVWHAWGLIRTWVWGPISIVLVMFHQAVANITPQDMCAEIYPLYKLFELTVMEKTHSTGTTRTNYKTVLRIQSPFHPPVSSQPNDSQWAYCGLRSIYFMTSEHPARKSG